MKGIMKSRMEKPSKSNVPFSQIIPPLLTTPLFVTPWDVIGLIYWMMCGIATLISLFNLLRSLYRLIRSNPSASYPPAWKANLRPLLTVAIFTAAVATGLIVELAASRYAEDLASRLQHSCKDLGRCPPAPEGWQVEGKFARSSYGHWTFVYVTNDAQSEFGLWIHRRHENERCIHGGSTITFSEVISVDCKSDPQVRFKEF